MENQILVSFRLRSIPWCTGEPGFYGIKDLSRPARLARSDCSGGSPQQSTSARPVALTGAPPPRR
jgi:hypothetical protein